MDELNTELKSVDSKVGKFLDDIMMCNNDQFNILREIRRIVFKNLPETAERMMYGGIMFSFENDFGGVFVRKNHVSFEFTNGYIMNDPDRLLEGTGKFRRHLKIKYLLDRENKKVESLVKKL